MADQIRIRPVRDADGRQLLGHWETACGYLVLPCRSLAGGFAKGVAVIRPRDEAPFAYLDCEQEAYLLLQADMAASQEDFPDQEKRAGVSVEVGELSRSGKLEGASA